MIEDDSYDNVLTNLLHILDEEDFKFHNLENGSSILYSHRRVRLKLVKNDQPKIRDKFFQWERLKSQERTKLYGSDSIIDFAIYWNVQVVDLISGRYNMIFKNQRCTLHSLKFSWAIMLTLKMFLLKGCNQLKVSTRKKCRGRRLYTTLTGKGVFTHIFRHVYRELEKCKDEKSMIKKLKNSLCLKVSLAMDQSELPEGDSFDYLPSSIWGSLKKSLSKEALVQFAFSCLQSKVLCQEVPEDFVLETLIKHRDQLSSPHRGLDKETLERLRNRGRDFGKLVKRYYNPDKGFTPTNKATYAFPRYSGGVKGDLVYHSRLFNGPIGNDPNDRVEPFVIGLFGQPGSGKSSRINDIISELSELFPYRDYNDLVYQRTCHVEHWDGYNHQPIVVFDDLGQCSDGKDIQEFITLVSTCPYTLPMADLSEKGRKFSSPIIICTSNLFYGCSLANLYTANYGPIIDEASFWRRFHVPLLSEKGKLYSMLEKPNWTLDNKLFVNRPRTCNDSNHLYFREKPCFVKAAPFLKEYINSEKFYSSNIWDSVNPIQDYGFLLDEYKKREKIHKNYSYFWNQTVVDDSNLSNFEAISEIHPRMNYHNSTFELDEPTTEVVTSLKFKAHPPRELLPVRVEPIREPLKVRTITAGIGDTFCLKPFQVAMWKALGVEPQFCLTHGTNRLESAIKRIYEKSEKGDVWISGDYSAATDSFAIEGSLALLEGILESIDHEPTKRWALKEISPHLLVYPKSSGLEPVVQKSGQLMGSLLSFPLLCLLNDCTAKYCGLSPEKYLINGDDILMRAPSNVYPRWKEEVTKFGLDLSLGKNYIHSRFGTVNSQLILDGKVVNGGKQKVVDRRIGVLGESLRDLEKFLSEKPCEEVVELFKTLNRRKLSQTVRSLYVPVSHGGLSFSWGNIDSLDKRDLKTIHRVYIYELMKRIEPQKKCISFPYFSREKKLQNELNEALENFSNPVSSKEFHEDFLTCERLNRSKITVETIQTNPKWRNLLATDIRNLPALSFLHTIQIPVKDEKVRDEVQKQIFNLFWERFLLKGSEFSYSDYRNFVIESSMNCQKETKAEIHSIIGYTDLDLPYDFLRCVPTDFKYVSPLKEDFEMKLFESDISRSLCPKRERIQMLGPDFSLDYEKDCIIQELNFIFKLQLDEEAKMLWKRNGTEQDDSDGW